MGYKTNNMGIDNYIYPSIHTCIVKTPHSALDMTPLLILLGMPHQDLPGQFKKGQDIIRDLE